MERCADVDWIFDMLSDTEEIDNYTRASEAVNGWIVSNWEKHFAEGAIEPWGKEVITNDGKRLLAVIPLYLRQFLEQQCGQAYSSFVSDALRARALDGETRRETIRVTKINGKSIRCVMFTAKVEHSGLNSSMTT